VLINAGLDQRQACYLHYQLDGGVVTLFDDEGDAIAGRGALGEDLILENGQVAVNLAGMTAEGEGDTLSVTWKLRFGEGFAGTRYVHLWARDRAACVSGWATAGWLQVTAGSSSGGADGSAIAPEAAPGIVTLPAWPGATLEAPPQPAAVRLIGATEEP